MSRRGSELSLGTISRELDRIEQEIKGLEGKELKRASRFREELIVEIEHRLDREDWIEKELRWRR